MSMKDDFVGFILSNGIKIVFDENPEGSVYFPGDELERVNDAIKILTDVKFEIKNSEESS